MISGSVLQGLKKPCFIYCGDAYDYLGIADCRYCGVTRLCSGQNSISLTAISFAFFKRLIEGTVLVIIEFVDFCYNLSITNISSRVGELYF